MVSASSIIKQVKEPLTPTTYFSWARDIEIILDGENLSEHLTTDPTEPAQQQVAAESKKKEGKVVRSILLQSISVDIRDIFVDLASPFEIWNKAKERYGKASRLKIARLRGQFFGTLQKQGQSAAEFIATKRQIRRLLQQANKQPSDEDYVDALLNGFRDQYESVVEALEGKESLSAADVEERVLAAEEARKSSSKSPTKQAETDAAFITSTPPRTCSHCQRTGHIKKTCWKLHTCSKCGKIGHPERFCKAEVENASLAALVKAAVGEQLAAALNSTTTAPRTYSLPSQNAISRCHTANSESVDRRWCVDSGCSSMMSGRVKALTVKQNTSRPIRLANNSTISSSGQTTKTVRFQLPNGQSKAMTFNVMSVPDLGNNQLFSVSKAVRGGRKMIFDESGCSYVEANGTLLKRGTLENGLYIMDLEVAPDVDESGFHVGLSVESVPGDTVMIATASTWHERFCHRNTKSLGKLAASGAVKSMRVSGGRFPSSECSCESCLIGKAKRKPFPKSGSRSGAYEVGELICSDICGKLSEQSLEGASYFITFVDAKSRTYFSYLLRTKDEAFGVFKRFQTWIERQSGRKMKVLRTDNAKEFISTEFSLHLAEEGIEAQTTVPYCSVQNALVERSHYSLMDAVRAMLHRARLAKRFWGAALMCASYTSRFWPHPEPALADKTRWEVLTGEVPSVEHLRVFGCDVYVYNRNATKLDARGQKMIFLGYEPTTKGWLCYNPTTQKTSIEHHVEFRENSFSDRDPSEAFRDGNQDEDPHDRDYEPETSESNDGDDDSDYEEDEGDLGEHLEAPPGEPGPASDLAAAGVRRSERPRRKPDRFGEWAQQARETVSMEGEVTRGRAVSDQTGSGVYTESSRLTRDMRRIDKELAMSEDECALKTVSSGRIFEPRTYEEAMTCPDAAQWQKAIDAELEELLNQKTWEDQLQCPPGTVPIGCRWLFTVKYKNGVFERYKARLVVKGYCQREGIDFNETFAPVVRADILRLVLAISVSDPELQVHHLDVKNAFVNGELKERLFMKAPKGYRSHASVVRLLKTLYGLKQAPREWHKVIDTYLTEKMGYQRVVSTTCLYLKRLGECLSIIILYVDDIGIVAHPELLKEAKKALFARFKMKDLGEMSYCLGLGVHRDAIRSKVFIEQSDYVRNLLELYGLSDCNAQPTPGAVGVKLSSEMCPQTDEDRRRVLKMEETMCYRSAVGNLTYVLHTRPEISFALCEVARYVENPGPAHYVALKRIFRYLKGTVDYGILYSRSPDGNVVLSGASDSDWAGDIDSRKSTSGYVFNIGSGTVTSKSKKQSCTSLSSCQAEAVAGSSAGQEAVWLRHVLRDLGFEQKEPTRIDMDNTGAISFSENQTHHSRMKHIDLRKFFLRELIDQKAVRLSKVSSSQNPADILTKNLGEKPFVYGREALGVIRRPCSIEGAS